jgi:dipeptidase
MCDTFVALGNSTKDGSVLFAKNSDRDPNEAHEIVIIPAAKHDPGSVVKCTYIEIPQIEHTYRVLLSKPFWIWGAEMGSNEFGVTIGNEAVFTREPYDKKPGLIGMDFLRLALERSKTAETAMNMIIELLEKHGQGGNCGYAHPFFYHNSYLICDASEAWVLETAGKQWAAEKVKDIRSISNAITIGKSYDKASEGLVQHALEKGWCKSAVEFDFGKHYSDPLYTFFADARKRQTCTTDSLREKLGRLEAADMMAVLRTHSKSTADGFTPGKGLMGADVCMHAGFGPIRASQSAGSMVSVIRKDEMTHWLTGTAAPCTSIFKPVWIDSGIPESVKTPGKTYDVSVMFWRHEALHREIIKDYASRIKVLEGERAELEAEFLKKESELHGRLAGKRTAFSKECFDKADEVEKKWLNKVKAVPFKHKNHFYYTMAWKKLNEQAEMPC